MLLSVSFSKRITKQNSLDFPNLAVMEYDVLFFIKLFHMEKLDWAYIVLKVFD